MRTSQRIGTTGRGNRGLFAAFVFVIFGTAACGRMLAVASGRHIPRPAASEFGLGPRASAQRLYTVSLQPTQALRPRQMQTVRIAVTDAGGMPVDGATIASDGGMPQHGHGLPTRPRVTSSPGGGLYDIEGVRFNMGGWWEFKLAISGPSGADTVTFNLDL